MIIVSQHLRKKRSSVKLVSDQSVVSSGTVVVYGKVSAPAPRAGTQMFQELKLILVHPVKKKKQKTQNEKFPVVEI